MSTYIAPYGRCLIALNSDGTLRWERSYCDVAPWRHPRLLLLDGRPLLLLQNDTVSASDIAIFAIDMESAELTHISIGGTRNPRLENTSACAIDNDRILISIGGGSMVALDTQLAIEAVTRATDFQ